jgi:hypothetical protein
MTKRLVLLMIGWATAVAATSMRRVARVQSGPYIGSDGRVVCCDSDHDSLPEMFFRTGTIHPTDPLRNEAWEHLDWSRFSLVFADTGTLPGTTIANPIPFAVDDVDDDGLTDIVCISTEDRDSGRFYCIVMTLESPDSFSYPCSLSWYYRYSGNGAIPIPTYYPPDLDDDGRKEIFCGTPTMGGCVWENAGNDQNELVWQDSVHDGYRLAFGDFDLDGRMDLATSGLGSAGVVSVWECTGDDTYEVVYQDTVYQPNGADVFTTDDIDGDGKPEFYVAYENVPRGKMYLYMWEMVGDDNYSRTLVDSVSFSGTDWGRISECGDIDGDGIDECIWTTPDIIKVYKAVGDNDLEEVWHWNNDHGGFRSLVSTVYDINNDGYNELITAGNAKISSFEIDAVDLVSPNRGTYDIGDTVPIRWVAHSPPRCDSISLLLRVDTLWHYQTIARGLPGTDTLYRWVVPGFPPDTGRFVVVAYGPGWQYDISDSVVRFTAGGVAEGARNVPLQWSLSVSPNPARGAFTVRYDVPGKWGQSQPLRGQTEVQSPFSTVPVFALGIYDADGRLVRSLSEGGVAPGRYEVRLPSGSVPAGVYFFRLDTPGFRSVKKAVVTR